MNIADTKVKIVALCLFLFSFFLTPGRTFSAGEAAVSNFVLNPLSVPTDVTSAYSFSFKVTSSENAIRNVCGPFGNNLFWEIKQGIVVAKNGQIPASDFLLSATRQVVGGFPFSPPSSVTSMNFQVIVGCGNAAQGTKIEFDRSDIVVVNVTGYQPSEIATIEQFNAGPTPVNPSSPVNFSFILRIKSSKSAVDNACRDKKITWRVYKFPVSNPDNFTTSNEVQSGAIVSNDFGSGLTLSRDFPKVITTPNENFMFKTRLECNKSGTDAFTVSSPAVIYVSGGGGGTCNNNGVCDAGETSATCKDCPVIPGGTQVFKFKLTNPLQAKNLLELIDVLATWLFNLAIPVVVIMIVYSGVMFLTSRGDMTKVTKARQILLYAVVGFAIILIGKGFITLIESILNLGTGA